MSVMTARSALAPRAPLIAVLAIATLAIAGVAVAITRVPSPAVELPSAGANTASLLAGAERRAVLEGGRLDLSVILATTAYFRATGQEKMGAQLGADTGVVLLFAEDVHSGDLPAQLRPILTLDGRAYEVSRAEVLVDATHHRVTALAYSDPHLTLVDPAVKTLALEVSGATDELRWDRPFGASSASAPVLSVPMILALFGGLLASMWPCLLQLSAYFLPSVAGLSLVETEGGAKRMSVLKTAVLFVSGIVIVYTLDTRRSPSAATTSSKRRAGRSPSSPASSCSAWRSGSRCRRARRWSARCRCSGWPGASGTGRSARSRSGSRSPRAA
jgi:hypothetical protein